MDVLIVCTLSTGKAHGGQKKELNPMELGLQMVVSHHICTETEAGSCVRITNALNF